MATFGWVHEDAREAILAATDHVPEPSGPLPPSFPCPFCGRSWSSPGLLQDHLAREHHISRPILLVGGKEPKAGFTVRERRSAKDFVLVNATSLALRIDGMSETTVSEKELGRILAGLKVGTVKIAIANASERLAAPVTGIYDFAFQIAAPRALHAVERAFLERLTVNGLNVGTVGEFRADFRCQGAASDYATGMAEYVLGVLVKERPHGHSITSTLDRYRSLFGSALEKLTPHQRPLPQLLCSVMRFALNQFGTDPIDTGYHELDAATVMLRGPSSGPAVAMPVDIPGRQAACPVDHGTDWILGLAGRMSRQDRWGPVLRDECRQAAETGTLDIMDRQKALALWALTALRLGAPQEAVEPLAQISATYPFSTWAASCLETVTT